MSGDIYNNKKSENKLYYVSSIRVMAMFMIVLFHSLCFYAGTWGFVCAEQITPIWKFMAPPIVNMGLTFFVLVSGFLYAFLYRKGYYRNTMMFIRKKATRLLIPFFVWGVYQIYCIPGLNKGWTDMLYSMSHLWFLMMLFEIFMIVTFISKLNIAERTTWKKDCIIFILTFVPYVISSKFLNAHSILCIETSFKYLPVFIVGLFLCKYRIPERIRLEIAYAGILVGGAFLLLLSYDEVSLKHYIYTMVSIIIGIFVFVILSQSNKNYRIVGYLDNYCMGIYLLNQIVIFYLLLNPDLREFFMIHNYWGPFIIFAISFFVPLFITKIAKRTKWFSVILG